MKKRNIYLIAILFMILISYVFTNLTLPKQRYHQHILDQQAEEKTEEDQELFTSHLPIMEVQTIEDVPPLSSSLIKDLKSEIHNLPEQKFITMMPKRKKMF